jgi:hypothetical protein
MEIILRETMIAKANYIYDHEEGPLQQSRRQVMKKTDARRQTSTSVMGCRHKGESVKGAR